MSIENISNSLNFDLNEKFKSAHSDLFDMNLLSVLVDFSQYWKKSCFIYLIIDWFENIQLKIYEQFVNHIYSIQKFLNDNDWTTVRETVISEKNRTETKKRSVINYSGYMVFLTKVKSEQKVAETTMPSEINESYNQIRATDLSALLFKGKEIILIILFFSSNPHAFPQRQKFIQKREQIKITVVRKMERHIKTFH